MIKVANKKNESVEDPHELLLSLVDLGSLDADEVLLACVSEMSDAECKRVLSSLSLPSNTEMEDEEDMDMDLDDMAEDEPEAEEPVEDEEPETEEADADEEDEEVAELEARIRKLEKCLKEEDDEEDDEKCDECDRRRVESRVRRLEKMISRKNETRMQHYVDPEDIRGAAPANPVYDAVEELMRDGVPEDELVERLSEDYGFELGNDYSRAGLKQAIIRAEMHMRRR